MINEDFAKLLEKIAPTPFLLHFTRRKSWLKIQKEGLVPQKNKQKDIYTKILPDHVIWLGKEPVEAYINKDQFPIVIAVPMNCKKYNLQETISGAEYITENRILPEEFLGVFDFSEIEGENGEKEFLKWLRKMEKKSELIKQ